MSIVELAEIAKLYSKHIDQLGVFMEGKIITMVLNWIQDAKEDLPAHMKGSVVLQYLNVVKQVITNSRECLDLAKASKIILLNISLILRICLQGYKMTAFDMNQFHKHPDTRLDKL